MKLSQHFSSQVRTITSIGCVAFSVAFTTACAPGFQANSSSTNGANAAAGTGGAGSGTGTTSPGWDAINIGGAINGGRFDKTRVIEIDKVTKTLIVRLPFIAGFTIGAQLPMPIREIPGTTVGLEPNPDGSSAIVVRIPLASVLRGVDTLPMGRLPNGDRLPAIPEGELPSVGLSFNGSTSLKGALYLSPSVVGIFIATPFNPYIQLTLPIRDDARTRTYGYFTSIPAKAGFNGGFFLSVAIPDDISRAIDDLL